MPTKEKQTDRKFSALPDLFSVAAIIIALGLILTAGPISSTNDDVDTSPESGTLTDAQVNSLITTATNADNNILSAVAAMLKHEEGLRKFIYTDTTGTPTIGYGTSLGNGITIAEATFLLNTRLKLAWTELNNMWPHVEDQPQHVKMALLDMSYQLGVKGLLEFHSMFNALEKKDYEGAKAAGLNSLWAKQTPKRALRVLSEFLEK